MQREIVKFQIDVPQVVRLDFSEGKEVTTKAGGKQWQYTLNHGQAIMWLPLAGRQAIERCGAQTGDNVRILKTYMGQQTVFTAQVVQQAPAMPAQRSTPALVHNGNGKHLPARMFYQSEGTPQPAARPSLAAREQRSPLPRCIRWKSYSRAASS